MDKKGFCWRSERWLWKTNKRMNFSFPKYPMKIWVLTLLLAPCLWVLGNVVGVISLEVPHGVLESLALFWMVPIFYIMGILMSFPVLGVFLLLYHFLKDRDVSLVLWKSIFTVMGILGIFLTFVYIGGTDQTELALCYSSTLTTLIWTLKRD